MLQHERPRQPLSLTECCWNHVLEMYVNETSKGRDDDGRDVGLLSTIERAAELCTEDRVSVTFVEGKRYGIDDETSVPGGNYKFIWREYELLSVTELFRHIRSNVFGARLCVTDFFVSPFVRRALLNCRFRITRCLTRNERTGRYSTVMSEPWQVAAYRESLSWLGQRYVIRDGEVTPNPELPTEYAREDYALKSYYTNDALFVLSNRRDGFDELYEYDRYNEIKIIGCAHCNALMRADCP